MKLFIWYKDNNNIYVYEESVEKARLLYYLTNDWHIHQNINAEPDEIIDKPTFFTTNDSHS